MAVKADAALVAASMKMGMANVPKDTSKTFIQQYKALGNLGTSQAMAFGNIGLAGAEIAKKVDQNKQFMQQRDGLINNLLGGVAEADMKNYEMGGGPDADTVEAQQNMLEGIKEKIEELRNIPGERTPQQNKQLKQLEKSVGAWRDETNKEMAKLKTYSNHFATDNVDFSQSFETQDTVTGQTVIDQNKKGLYTQITSSGIPLSKAGVTIGRNKDGERGYYYDPNVDRVAQTAKILSGEYTSEKPSKDPEKMSFITSDELFGNIVLKDKALNVDVAGIIGESSSLATVADYAIEIDPITGNKTKSSKKKLLYKDYSAAAPGQEDKFYNRIMQTHEGGKDGELGNKRNVVAGIRYMSNNPIQIGDAKFNYNEESKKNPAITSLTYSELGLKGSTDRNNDGVITGDELSQEDQDYVRNKLMNPQNEEEAKVSARELARYLNGKAEDQFNRKREQAEMMGPRPKPTRTSGSGTEKNVNFDFKTKRKEFIIDEKTGKQKVDEQGNILGEAEFTKTQTTPTQLRNKTRQLFTMQGSNVSSFDTDNVVDLFGKSIGYFPGKGFAEVRVNEQGQVARLQSSKTKIPIGGYLKTPEAVFEAYSIPTEYSNIRTSNNRNTSFNSNK